MENPSLYEKKESYENTIDSTHVVFKNDLGGLDFHSLEWYKKQNAEFKTKHSWVYKGSFEECNQYIKDNTPLFNW